MKEDVLKKIALKLILEELTGARSGKKYIEDVKYGVKLFYRWMENSCIKELTTIGKKELINYYKFLCSLKVKTYDGSEGKVLAVRTVNGHFCSVKKIFNILYLTGSIKENPLSNLKVTIPLSKEIKRRPLTKEEINYFLENIDTEKEIGLRDRTLFELIYSSGLRVSEAANLKISDVNLDKREIIVRGKGSRDRIVPISIVAHDFLKLYIGERIKEEGAVFKGTRAFNSEAYPVGNEAYPVGSGTYGDKDKTLRAREVSRRFRTLLRKFDMDKKEISTHSIRHSTATHLLDNGMGIRHVQELLGHKNIENTVRYTHVQTEGLFKVYRKYHPREHELFETVDDEYLQRLEKMVCGK